VRRTITLLINTILLLGGWAGIILINLYDKTIQQSLSNVEVLKYVSSFFPNICLSLINIVIPVISKKLVIYESWDF